MNTTETGNIFENKVYAYFKSLLDNDELPYANKKFSRIYKHKTYKCIGERRTIDTDISIETYNLNQSEGEWSQLIIIECKNYKSKVDIADFDEFENKLRKISSSGIKGIFVTTNGFSKNNIEQARNSHIALAVFPEENFSWIVTRNIQKDSEFLFPVILGERKVGIRPVFFFKGLFMSGYNLFASSFKVISNKNQFDIPFLSNEKLKEEALSLYNKCKNFKTDDIAGEIFAKFFPDYHVNFEYLPEGLLGYLDVKSKTIAISKDIINDEHRIHFTLAHELGHIYLHGQFLNYQLTNHKDCFSDNYTEYPDEMIKKMDIQANLFASYLLLPSPLFDRQIAALFKGENINKGFVYLDEQPCNKVLVYPMLEKLSKIFNVSKKVVEYRMIDDGYLKLSESIPKRIDRIYY